MMWQEMGIQYSISGYRDVKDVGFSLNWNSPIADVGVAGKCWSAFINTESHWQV